MPFVSKLSKLLGALTLSMALGATTTSAQTITAVLSSGLRALDPIVSTSVITSIHALMVYDLLLAQDRAGKVQPQMVSWKVSPDGTSYTFTLRDGLKWQDGTPVTSEDCIASIKRWGQADTMGQVIMSMVTSMRAVDATTFTIELNRPSDLLLEGLAKTSARPAFMMPKRLAETPISQPVKEVIGSGPFRFVASKFEPGIKAVYEKNRDYVPRKGPASGAAGGKVVNVDRVVLVAMPDQMTAVNALLNGEVDFIDSVSYDLLPMLEGKSGIKVRVVNQQGSWTMMRMNFLYPPFNNKLLRQAAMVAVSQEDVLKALVGNPKYYRTCVAVFGCGTPYESTYGKDWVGSGNIEKAKVLLKEGKYDGTPVVILHPSDNPFASSQPLVVAQALRKAGFRVDVQTMDWQTLTNRRRNDKPPAEGGWNVFVTYSAVGDQSDPIRSLFVATAGKKSWYGWPDIPAIEQLRHQFALATNFEERKQLADEIDKRVIDDGVIVPLGQYVYPSAYSSKLSGVLEYSRPLFWNMKKAK